MKQAFSNIFGRRASASAAAPSAPPTSRPAGTEAASSAGAPLASGAPTLVIPAPAADAGSGSGARSGFTRGREALTPRTERKLDEAVDDIYLAGDIFGEEGQVELPLEGDKDANMEALMAMGMAEDAAVALARALFAGSTWLEGAEARAAGGYNADDLRSLCYASGEKPFPAIFDHVCDTPTTIFLLFDSDAVLQRALAEEAARLKIPVQELRKVKVARVPRAATAAGDAEADVGKGGSKSDAGFSLGFGADGVVGFSAGKDAAHFTSAEARDLAQSLRTDGRPRLAEAIERALNFSRSMTDLIESVVGSTAPTLRAATFTGELVDVTVKTFGDSGASSLVLVAHTPVKIRIGVAHYVYKFSGQRHWSCVLALLFAAYFSVFALNPTFSSDGKGVVQLTRMLVPRALGQTSAAAKGTWRIDVATGERRFIDGSPGMTTADLIRMGKISAGDILLVASGKVKLVYVAAAERGEAAAVAEREGRVGSV
jgi:hypothetical protein